MLSENPYDTFLLKMSYIFIKFGSEWLKSFIASSHQLCL